VPHSDELDQTLTSRHNVVLDSGSLAPCDVIHKTGSTLRITTPSEENRATAIARRQHAQIIGKVRPCGFWPTVQSVAPLVHCVVCLFSVVCDVLYCGETVRPSQKLSEGNEGQKLSLGFAAIFLLPVSLPRPPRRLFLPYFCTYSLAILGLWDGYRVSFTTGAVRSAILATARLLAKLCEQTDRHTYQNTSQSPRPHGDGTPVRPHKVSYLSQGEITIIVPKTGPGWPKTSNY